MILINSLQAVYSRASHLILDDPLSAVDSHTSSHLYEKLLLGPILAGRTVILVTHHVELCLAAATLVVNVSEGTATVQEISSLTDIDHVVPALPETIEETLSNKGEEKKAPAKKFVDDEAREEGSVRIKVYQTYLEEFTYFLWFLLLLLIFLDRAVPIAQNFWLKIW